MISMLKCLFSKNKFKCDAMSCLTSKEYFFGKISRQRAEEILLESGGEDGRFLIRECLSSPRDYSLAMCFNGKPYHYLFQQQKDKGLTISGGSTFLTIDKMIAHHSKQSSGLITRLTHPCQRDVFGGAQVWPSISQSRALFYMTEAGKDKSLKYEEAVRRIYRKQVWFKGSMTRQESKEFLLGRSKRCNGEFVIREKPDGTLALSLVYEGVDYHYVITVKLCPDSGSSTYRISPGPEFDNVMELVSYYHNDGLICPLHLEYTEGLLSIPWLKPNPLFQMKRVNMMGEVQEKGVNKLSRSLESLDTSRLSQGYLHPEHATCDQSRNLTSNALCEPTKSYIKNPIEFNSRPPTTRAKCVLDRQKLGGSSSCLVRRNESEANEFVECLHGTEEIQSRPFLAISNSLSMFSSEGSSLFDGAAAYCDEKNLDVLTTSRLKSPSRSPKCQKKMSSTPDQRSPERGKKNNGKEKPLKEVEKEEESEGMRKSKKGFYHQQSAPSNQEGARKVSLTLTNLDHLPKLLSVSGPFEILEDSENSDDKLINICNKPTRPQLIDTKSTSLLVEPARSSRMRSRSPGITLCDLEPSFMEMIEQAVSMKTTRPDAEPPSMPTNPCPHISPTVANKKRPLPSLPPLAITNLNNIEARDLVLLNMLGGGCFGVVQRAKFKTSNGVTEVAIKTVSGCNKGVPEMELRKEAEMMGSMDHGNIIKLIGVSHKDRSFMIVLELAQLGNLKEYTRKNKGLHENNLVAALRQVCCGMSYLESKNIVHRDLAARNILLFHQWVAKISDFGLSRSLDVKTYYEFKGSKPLPLRWYPPEVFSKRMYSHKSDVWSFGVTMWECLSYDAQPYNDLLTAKFIEFITNDGRLKKPKICSDGLYYLMLMCWEKRQEDRPTFSELIKLLKHPYVPIVT